MGAFLGRSRRSNVSFPGGCVIGQRPLDLHIKGFEKLGCKVEIKNGYLDVDGSKMVGTRVFLGGRYGSTVTGTANVLMAATAAKGTTTIESAACEPEIVDLCNFLCKQGAAIGGIGSNTLTVEGGHSMHGCEYRVISDRIEACTLACAALITRGHVTIRGNTPHLAGAVRDRLDAMGASVGELPDGSIVVDGTSELRSTDIVTLAYPGFPTDLQAQFCALLCCVDGISVVSERIYPNRFMHVAELNRMGANIMLEGAHAIVHGSSSKTFSGAQVTASDLRASAALYIAGLRAQGETLVHRVYHIDRGYEDFDGKLRSLGAKIDRILECDVSEDNYQQTA
jgi:UDP-N-acetylglucosamine 1-carboxyvinyltransferase